MSLLAPPPVNILITLDSIAALSLERLEDMIFLTDDAWCSQDKGTSRLVTACTPGQAIHWRILAVDVQTPALIAGITFLPADDAPDGSSGIDGGIDPGLERLAMPEWRCWSLVVPCGTPPGRYRYRLAVQIGSGARSTIAIDGPALDVIV